MKKYIAYVLVITIGWIGISVLVSVYFNSSKLWLLMVVLYYLLSKPICAWIANKSFFPQLVEKLDAYGFKREIDSHKYFRTPVLYKILAETCTGNYQIGIDICNESIVRAKTKSKLIYLANLARIYFEMDDIDSLRKICKQFDLQSSKIKKLADKYPIFSFYKNYTENRYDKCIEFCEKRLENLKDKSEKYNFTKSYTYFNMAVAYLKKADNQNAKIKLKKVIEFAPNLHIAELSKEYLDRIGN